MVNIGAPVHLFKPAGDPDELLVEHGQVVEVPGVVVAELDDAYVIGDGDNARAWPMAQWELEKPAAKARGAEKE
jgi:hypothetical protein